MQIRARLRDVQLVGVRAALRRGGFLVVMLLAVVGFVGYLLPAHRVEGGAWHSNFADGGVWPLVVFAGIGVTAAIARLRGFGAGMLTGVLAGVAAVAAVAPVILTHLFQSVVEGPGEIMFAVAILGLFFGGALLLIAEPILYLLQRRADRRPALPVARIYATN